MTSFLIISPSRTALETAIQELCSEKSIDNLDVTLFDFATSDTKTGVKKSWGIDDIKAMQKKIYLKPLRGGWKAIVIHDAESLTKEAQNALLKTLEEPPDGTLLLLTASSIEPFLPTVLSRCTIRLLGDKHTLSEKETAEILSELVKIANAPLGDRLKKAETLSKSKEDVLTFIRSSILALHAQLIEESSDDKILLLKLLHEHYKLLKNSNTNVRMATEHLLLLFQKKNPRS